MFWVQVFWAAMPDLRPLAALYLCAGLCLCLCAGAVDAEEFKGERTTLNAPPYSQLRGRSGTRAVGKYFAVGKFKLKARVKNGKLYIGRTPGAGAIVLVEAGEIVTVRVRGRERKVVFVLDATGAWRFYDPHVWDYKIGKSVIRLVDLDCDGKFTVARDGYFAYGSLVACPLEKVFVCGTQRIEIKSIASDGSEISATIEPLKGSESQLAALVDLNRRRAHHGISPVLLDEALSRACTAHAEYLATNDWTGRTDPHSQTLGSKGASVEGEGAAGRSVITTDVPANAVAGFWTTYYHRGPLIHVSLRRVGINANARFSVIDVYAGMDRKEYGPWRDEVFVPADGSVGHFPNASTEMPRDPVPNMNSRGNPIQVHLRDADNVTKFTGSLFDEKTGKDVPVFVVERSGTLFGLVPKAALEPETSYRVTISYSRKGATKKRVTRFRTE